MNEITHLNVVTNGKIVDKLEGHFIKENWTRNNRKMSLDGCGKVCRGIRTGYGDIGSLYQLRVQTAANGNNYIKIMA